MDYQIITDSCCDYTDAQYGDLDVHTGPGVLGLFHLGTRR